MKVLFVSNDPKIFDATSAVHARLRAYAVALGLPAQAGELYIVSSAPSGAREAHEAPLHLYPVHTSPFFRIPALVWRARKLVREQGIEVVSAQDPFEYGLVAWKAALFTKAHLHIQLHTDPFAPGFANVGHPMSYINYARWLIMPFVLRRAARIRVVLPALKQHIVERFGISPERISVLSIYVDLARFRTVVRAPEKGILLWSGRFEREKGPMLALDALAAARAAGVDARLIMLGAGHLGAALKARAKQLGLDAFVEFPGYTDPFPYLARAELLLATSEYEGYGLAIIEALAAGVPVLSTDVGIAREAGAAIADRATYATALITLLRRGPTQPSPIPDPYPSFAEYVSAYVADLHACLEK